MKDNIIAITNNYFDGLYHHKEWLGLVIEVLAKQYTTMAENERSPDVLWLSDVIHSYSEDREDD
jgi:hypothetical protein